MKVTKIEIGKYHVLYRGELFQVEDMRYYNLFDVGDCPWEIKHIDTNAYTDPQRTKREAQHRIEQLFDEFITERSEGFDGMGYWLQQVL